MYRFVCDYDYQSIIRDAVKVILTDNNVQVRLRAEQFAREEIESYLNTEYDVDLILNHQVFDLVTNQVRKKGDWIIKSDGTVYVCILEGANTTDITNQTKFLEDKLVIKQFVEPNNFTAGDTLIDTAKVKWFCIQNAPTGTALSDADYYRIKRNDLIVMLYCDIAIYHFHARINPSKVPQLRIDRYMDALDKLKRIRRKEMTPAIPRTDRNDDGSPDGGAIVYYSNEKRKTGWG